MAEAIKERCVFAKAGHLVTLFETAELSLTVSGGATPSLETDPIDVMGMKRLMLTIDHKRTGSDSTDLDTSIYSSPDGSVFDTEAYASDEALGAAKVKTIAVTAGVAYVKLKVENMDAGNATKVKLTLVGTR